MAQPALWQVAGVMFVAMTCIVIGDIAGKLLTQSGVSPLFVAWTRFALACIVLLPFMGLRRSDLPALRAPLVWLRALLVAGGISCILTALKTEPIANAFGAFFIGPMVAYVLAFALLKERITPARTALLALGFAGVLLVIKPGFGFTPGLGFALMAGALYGGYLTATRAVARLFRPRLLLISQLLIGAAALAPLGLAALPESLTLPLAGLILVSALASALGNLLLVTLSRTTDSSIIAPLVYLQLISATVLGYLVFNDWPDALSIAGLAIILTSGLAGLAQARR